MPAAIAIVHRSAAAPSNGNARRSGLRAIAALVACVIIGLSSASSAVAQTQPVKPHPGREVRDLHYGDVLFYFYQDDYFEAITRLMAAREMGRAENNKDDGDLLMGGMLLSYGQYQQAGEIFQRLLDTTAKPEVRDRAWFYLARLAYERDAPDRANDALDHIKGKLPPRLDAEREVLQSQVLMGLNRFDDAAKILATWKGPDDWAAYARFNLGVALVREQRVDEGLKYLDQAGADPANGKLRVSPEQRLLRDRANLALAFAAIQADKPATAVTALQRVRMEGPYSNKALLGLGWADSALGHDSEALTPWMELNKRDLADPAVQESLLAVPYAMARLHAYSQAASHYESAIRAFDEEGKRIDASIAGIRAGHLVSALLAGEPADDAAEAMGWGWHLGKLPGIDESRFLLPLIATNDFQQGLKNYRDLHVLRANLQKWSHDVATFADMLDTQKLAFAQRQPKVRQALQQIDLDAISSQRNALAARLADIESTHDAVGLANTTELGQWSVLEGAGKRIDALGDAPEARDSGTRHVCSKGCCCGIWTTSTRCACGRTSSRSPIWTRPWIRHAQDAGRSMMRSLRDRSVWPASNSRSRSSIRASTSCWPAPMRCWHASRRSCRTWPSSNCSSTRSA